MRAKALEPVTLVRSPTLTNSVPSPMKTGSRPESFMGECAGQGSRWTSGNITDREKRKGDENAEGRDFSGCSFGSALRWYPGLFAYK